MQLLLRTIHILITIVADWILALHQETATIQAVDMIEDLPKDTTILEAQDQEIVMINQKKVDLQDSVMLLASSLR